MLHENTYMQDEISMNFVDNSYYLTYFAESLTLNGTKAKLLLIYDLLTALFQLDGENSNNLQNSSIMADACSDEGNISLIFTTTLIIQYVFLDFPYMELYVEGIGFKKVTTHTTVSIDMSLNSVKAFIFETFDHDKLTSKSRDIVLSSKQYYSKNIQQILFISGPEPRHGHPPDQRYL